MNQPVQHTNSQSNLPEKVRVVLQSLNLRVVNEYRNGPRYWVGKVSREGQALLLKVVIEDTAWESPTTGKEFSPADQLRAEILLFDRLGKYRVAHDTKESQPTLIESASDHSWILRRHYSGHDMAAGESPFIFHETFFQPATYRLVLDHIAYYQNLTPILRTALERTPLAGQHTLEARMLATDLENPTELLAPYAVDLKRYLEKLYKFHDDHLDTLAHGQVYPPHIYVTGNEVNFIDWENAGLNNAKLDYASLWIRGFGRPQWQADFISEMTDRGLLANNVDHQLWDIEVAIQSAGNLNYLHWSQIEKDEVQRAAVASLGLNIENVLS